MKDRIRSVMEETGLSQQDFANKIGISPASLSSIFTGRTNPTNNHVQAIHNAFPNISVNWLMFNEGPMHLPLGNESDNLLNRTLGGTNDTIAGLGMAGGRNMTMADMFSSVGAPNVIEPPLTSQESNQEGCTDGTGSQNRLVASRNRTQSNGRGAAMNCPQPVIKVEGPKRKIKEIRVFFDDGTYEAFVPAK